MDIQMEKGIQKPTHQDGLSQTFLSMGSGESFWVPDDESEAPSQIGTAEHDESKWNFGGRTGLNLCRYLEEKALSVGVTVQCHVEEKDGAKGVRCFND